MYDPKQLEKLKKLTGESDEELLSILLEDAESYVLSYTNRTKLVSGLDRAVRDLAVIAINRRGTEGETGRSEGGESYSFDAAPKQIYDTLDRFRLARIGGVAHESKAKQDTDLSPQTGE